MWHERYLGKPWAAVPDPPLSFTCGELIRFVYRETFGYVCLPIPVPSADDLGACLRAMRPEYFGLLPVVGAGLRDRDAVFLSRRSRMDHCGLVVLDGGEMWVLHCSQRGGTQLSSWLELRAQGYTGMSFWRCPLAEGAA